MGSAHSSPRHFSSPSPWISDDISVTTTTATGLEEFPGNHEEENHHKNMPNPSLPFHRYGLSAGRQLISLFATDAILKFFAVIFYGVLPCGFKNHTKKLRYSCFSVVIVLLHWHNVFVTIYFTVTFGKPMHMMDTGIFATIATVGQAMTCTLVTYYFYRDKNNFSNDDEQGWSIIPSIHFDLATEVRDSRHTGPTKTDWFLANIFLSLGFCSIGYSAYYLHILFASFNAKFDYLSPQQRLLFGTGFFNLFTSGAFLVSCVIFNIITRDLIRHIEYTENAILVRARNRDDFYRYHQSLHEYTDKMVASCKHWFAIHGLLLIGLVSTAVIAYLKSIKRHKTMTLQNQRIIQCTVGLMHPVLAAFHFISASRVTSKFSKFYFSLNMKCKVHGIPDLSMLRADSGFKVYGFRINTSAAILTILPSFAGLLKILYSLI